MATPPFDLLLFAPKATGSDGFVETVANPIGWRRSVRSEGGFWQGSFTMAGEPTGLINWFYNRLGYHLIERIGTATSWAGMIYELELDHRGHRLRRSLDTLYNAVDISYQDEGEVLTAGFATEATPINRYGRRELILAADGEPQATAEARRDLELSKSAWAWARPVSLQLGAGTRLEVKVCGYAFTANWMHAKAGDDTEHDLDHWISAVVGTAYGLSSDHGGSTSGAGDCQFLKAGVIDSNTLQVLETTESDMRAWEQITKIVAAGDSATEPWRLWVGLDRKLNYREIDLSPRYYRRNGRIYETPGGDQEVVPWLMGPAVLRDLDYPVKTQEPGSWLEDARDVYLDQIEVQSDGSVSFQAAHFLHETEFVEVVTSDDPGSPLRVGDLPEQSAWPPWETL